MLCSLVLEPQIENKLQYVAKTTGFAANTTPLLFPGEKVLRNFVAFFNLNGNKISQQRFTPEDPAQHDDRMVDLVIGQTLRAMSGDETEPR
jgi:hypothetical protein